MFEVVRTLDIETQKQLLEACRDIVRQAPLLRKKMPNGRSFRYLCTSAGRFGWFSDSKGYRYELLHPETNRPWPPIPACIHDIAVRVAQEAGLTLDPQSALVNWYGPKDKLGLHQDITERCDAPVVSISIGDDCRFAIGGEERTDPKSTLILHSGDVMIMSEEHRYHFHEVRKIYPGTAPEELGMRQPGRVNITVRQVEAL